MARIKTRYVGVYYRYGKNRVTCSGKADRCFDIHYKANGKYVWEKVGWHSEGYTLEDAIKLRGQRVKALRHPELEGAPAMTSQKCEVTIGDAWSLYKEKWFPNIKSPKNIEYIYENHIAPVFEHTIIEDISALDIENFKQKLLAKKLKPSTVKKIMSDFRRIINKSYSFGLLESTKSPVCSVSVPGADSKRERYLTAKDVERLFDALQFVSCTLWRVAYISLHTGMRISEVVSIKSKDVNLEAGLIYINGKTGPRCAYISDDLKVFFSTIQGHENDGYIFASKTDKTINTKYLTTLFTQIVNDIGLNSGVTDNSQRVVFHTLRHTFCSWLAINGVPLYTIGELVGHSTVEMTRRYAKLSPDSKRDALKFISMNFIG